MTEGVPLLRDRWTRGPAGGRVEAVALAYVALPSIVFLVGWLRWPWGLAGALAIAISLALRPVDPGRRIGPRRLGVGVLAAVALLWAVLGGQGHFVFTNSDWVVRDAVLLDLVRYRWPVTYVIDHVDFVMRAPIGYFLPASLVGQLAGIRAAELAQLAWTVAGVVLVFVLMLSDRPSPKAAAIRMVVFIVFSGMDIVGNIIHYGSHRLGEHLEWWEFLFQYSSHTTQLFWVPNHALPGWIAIAWLLAQEPRRLPIAPAILFVAFTPLWSPLTAIGLAPIVAAALLRQCVIDRPRVFVRELLDATLLVPVLACLVFIVPYLVIGTDQVASSNTGNVRWVGEDLAPRIIEFVLIEFAGFAVLLLRRDHRDPLLWTAVVVLLLLPIHRFGPYNDLAMRASIPALALLAIRVGHWLSQPVGVVRDRAARCVAVVLLAIGAVTPFMEVARVFIEPRRPLDTRSSLIDVTRGAHYLTPSRRPWMDRFLARPEE